MVWLSYRVGRTLMLVREPFVNIFLSSMDGVPQAGCGITLIVQICNCRVHVLKVALVLFWEHQLCTARVSRSHCIVRRLNRIASTLPANQFCLLSSLAKELASPAIMIQFARVGYQARMGPPIRHDIFQIVYPAQKLIFRPIAENSGPKNFHFLILTMFWPLPGNVVQRKKNPFPKSLSATSHFGVVYIAKN